MECVQAKPALASPDRNGVERLKAEHGYVGGSLGRRPMGPKPAAKEEGGGGASRWGPPPLIERKMECDLVDGWPRWLVSNVPKRVLDGLALKSADNYVMIGKVGQGTYSNVYKARDKETGKLVALKKVRFDKSESERVRFMAREIIIFQKLDHPNVLKLKGLATSRMQYSLYLVFEFMQTDLARIISRPDGRLTEPQGTGAVIRCHRLWSWHFDLWSAGCLLAEMFPGRPIMPGRTAVQ